MSDKPIKVDLARIEKIKRGPIIHEELPESLVEKASKIYDALKELNLPSLKNPEEWINDFKRDVYPEREIAVWEWIAEEFLKKTKGKEMSFEKKREIFEKIFEKSFFGEPA